MTVKEFLNKFDNPKETFSSEELRDLYWWDIEEEDDDVVNDIDHLTSDNRRWSRVECEIRQINDRYFCFRGDIGLTEYQDNEFYSQPSEVSPVEEWIKVVKWVEI